MDILRQLNPQQREAVLYNDGPMIIVAGAGSGKTRVITYKIAYLLKEKRIKGHQILAVTFTNKAANEMKERVQRFLSNVKPVIPSISTFHSFCAGFLRKEIQLLGITPNYTIYDADDQKKLIKVILSEKNIGVNTISPGEVRSAISFAKNQLLTPEKYIKQNSDRKNSQLIYSIYKEYDKRLRQVGALDFGDLIMFAIKLLKEHPNVSKKWNNRYSYILVDEFQDTNIAQYKLILQLRKKNKKICVVGDEDQSIYGFRGADITNIFNFEKDFRGTRIFKLEQNYRCTQTILTAASALIANNNKRREKTLWTENRSGDPIALYQAASPEDEARWVAKSSAKILEQDSSSIVAVLYRINAQSRRIEDAFRSIGLKYKVIGGTSFYGRKEIKDIMAYVKFLSNPADDISLSRIINEPPRGIGRMTIEMLNEKSKSENLTMWEALEDLLNDTSLNKRSLKALSNFYNTILEIKRAEKAMGIGSLIEAIYKGSGYKTNLLKKDNTDSKNKEENIKELILFAKEFENSGGSKESFIDYMSLASDTDESTQGAKIILMTLHSAKGLEFDYVFMVGMEEGILPHKYSVKEQNIEEERRICYVGMTRAKKALAMSYCRQRINFDTSKETKTIPSSFLSEIPPHCIVSVNNYTGYNKAIFNNFYKIHEKSDIKTYNSKDEILTFFKRKQNGKKSSKVSANNNNATKYKSHNPQKETQSSLSNFKVGDSVEHFKFGHGKILKISKSSIGRKITIYFDKSGVKTLIENVARLDKL